MARTTKDTNEIEKNKKTVAKDTTKSVSSKKILPKEKKTVATKKAVKDEKKVITKKTLPKEKKATSEKKLLKEKKVTLPKEKKSSITKTKSPKEKKVSSTTRKSKTNSSIKDSKKTKSVTKTTKSKRTSKAISPIVSEHYDLPNTYNKTFIVLLAQTPKTLFAFWEISDSDRNSLTEKYGSHFFENTRPVLVIINKTTNTSFEIEINDYAKDWYIDIEKTDCEFEIQLGRKPYNATNDFILIASSNALTSPNDHILLERLPKTFKFLNLKTNEITEKSINNVSFSQIYNIYNFYKEMYKDELQDNPSSK